MKTRHILLSTATAALATVTIGGRAEAGSVTEPGFTTGVPLYAAGLPEGLYLVGIPDYSHRNTNPDTDVKAFTPFFVYQSPLKIAGARIMAVAAPVYLDVRIKNHTYHADGFYNTYLGVQATWDLGHGWGAGFRMSGWTPQSGSVALPYGTVEPRAGITYYSPTAHFTANVIRGYTIEGKGAHVAPNYVNLDLTYTRTFNKLELGAVAFGSTDTNRPFAGYNKQSQFAVGPLVGYNFGRFQAQLKLTSDVYESHYGSHEKRAEMNITLPLWTPKAPPPDPVPVRP